MNQNVLLDDKKDSQEPKLVLSMEEWNELRAASLHQQLQMHTGSEPTVQAKLPLLGPAERAQMEWTRQLDALAKVVDTYHKNMEPVGEDVKTLKSIAGVGDPIPGFTPGLPVALQPAIRQQAGRGYNPQAGRGYNPQAR